MVNNLEKNLRIGMLLRMLYFSLVGKCNRDLADIDLTGAQGEVIGYLMSNEGREVNQKDIEKEYGLMNPTVTGILKRLEKKGFIIRLKSRQDERCKIIELTEKGRRIHEKMREKGLEVEKLLLRDIPETEIDTFVKVLKKLIENMSRQGTRLFISVFIYSLLYKLVT